MLPQRVFHYWRGHTCAARRQPEMAATWPPPAMPTADLCISPCGGATCAALSVGLNCTQLTELGCSCSGCCSSAVSSPVYEFNFTSVLGTLWGSVDGLQLGGLALFDYDNELLTIASITNPGGSNTANQGPSNLIDYQPSDRQSVEAALTGSNAKWFDGNFATSGSSTLRITLAQPGAVAGYMFSTARDVRRRDPVSWTLRVLGDGGAFSHEVDTRARVAPPSIAPCRAVSGESCAVSSAGA